MDSEPLSHTLPPLVNNRETAIQFIRWCVAELGLGYHPDTAFGAYVGAQGDATFAPDEARQLARRASEGSSFPLLAEPRLRVSDLCEETGNCTQQDGG